MDIFNLNKSKLRKELLKLYFAHPERKYYLRELERILKLPVANIRRELLNLEKSGIFAREVAGKQVYFFLNTKSPIFTELKNIVFKTIGIEVEILGILKKFEHINTAFIFGSYACGKEDAMSDVDLMIVGRIDENQLIEKISKLEKRIDREVNYHIFSEVEFEKQSKHKDSFLAGILKKPIIFLVKKNENVSSVDQGGLDQGGKNKQREC